MRNPHRSIPAVLAAAALLQGVAALADSIPLQLPRPDGRPGDMTQPVKVYILAGQSNMVGMGDLAGARPPYPSVFLAADPAIIPGRMPIGDGGLDRHAVYQSAAADAAPGALASVYAGDYDPEVDDARRTPVKTAVVALGTVAETLPALDEPHTVEANAAIEVPVGGIYTVYAGFEDSRHNVVALDGREVYRKEMGARPVVTKVALEAGRRYPLTITYFEGGSAAFWLERVDIEGRGDLQTLTRKDGKFPYVLDDEGNWSERRDVLYVDPRLFPNRAPTPLSATSNNGKSIGPELGFGHVMGTFHDEQVLLIKIAQGNRSLGFDFRPPSSGRSDPESEVESQEYRLLVEGVRETLAKIDEIVPGYRGQGYEIVGFGWFQGHKDRGATKEEYERHLVHLIDDLRRDLEAPDMRAVVAAVGFHGYRLREGPWRGVWEAQMAVGDAARHPRFAGTVASVDTRDFWREIEESPRSQDFHYHRNPETYLLIGEAMGRAMVGLLGGRAEAIPKSDREAQTLVRMAEEAARTAPTAEQVAASRAAAVPMILDGALGAFLNQPGNQALLQAAVGGDEPASEPQVFDRFLDDIAAYYRAAGIRDYNWHRYGPKRNEMEWNYYSFDPVEQPPSGEERARLGRYREVTYPEGMENWFAPDFDAAASGWKRGLAPFASSEGELPPHAGLLNCQGEDDFCGCGEPPRTLWEKEVLLLNGTFEVPPFEEDYAYRILIGGMSHVGAGDGARIYLNGRLIYERRTAVDRRGGGVPIGTMIDREWWPEFERGRVRLAATSFLKYHPRSGRYGNYITVFLQRMRLPALNEELLLRPAHVTP